MQKRLRAILLAVLTVTGSAALTAPPAAAGRHAVYPCGFGRWDGETIQHFSKRRITCAVDVYGPVRGGARRAICIAKRESGLVPNAQSPTGMYLGLFQQASEYWPWRFDRYTAPSWQLSDSALNGRSNAIVTIRMVHSFGGWRPAGWRVGGC